MSITPLGNKTPQLGTNIFLAPNAWVIGDVVIEDKVSIFFGAVLRGDLLPIRVGKGTNIQEHTMIHTTNGRSPAIIGENVTIGHRAIVHGCHVKDCCLIGMGAIILDDSVIEEGSLVAAGSVVTEKKRFPARSLIAGIPAKVIRTLTDKEVSKILQNANAYMATGAEFIDWQKNTLPYL